jgi:diguanylate cyclase (GGDEF)-like protein
VDSHLDAVDDISTPEGAGVQDVARAIVDQIPIALFVLNASGEPIYANRAAVDLLGKGIVKGLNANDLASVYQARVAGTNEPYPAEQMPIVRALRGETSVVDDMVIKQPDGDTPIEVWGSPILGSDGKIVFAAAAFTDISRRKSLEAELRAASETDQLTGLKNRAALMRELARGIHRLDRSTSCLAIGFVDLDNFKAINDTYGHGIGDEVLQRVGQRLAEISRSHENAYRVGGDEFVMIWEDLDDPETAKLIADRFKRALSEPVEASVGVVQLGATIGIATASSPHVRLDELLMKADENMYALRGTEGAGERRRIFSRSDPSRTDSGGT